MSSLERQFSRAVVEEHLPRALTLHEIKQLVETAHVTATTAGDLERAIEETQNLVNVTKNVVRNDRAHCEYLLDYNEVNFVNADVVSSSSSGVIFQHVSAKTNKNQETKKKGLSCSSCCPGKLALLDNGMIDWSQFCAAHLVEHLRGLVLEYLGVSREDLSEMRLPLYGSLRTVQRLVAGKDSQQLILAIGTWDAHEMHIRCT